MSSPAQKRATQNYRNRLAQKGITRFEVQGLEADRELLRALARRLAGEGPEAQQMREAIQKVLSGELPGAGSKSQKPQRPPPVTEAPDLFGNL